MWMLNLWTFELFRKWLIGNCKTRYTTSNLGHKGNGISVAYALGSLTIRFGGKGKSKALTDAELLIIFDHYKRLGPKRHMPGHYSYGIFKNAPDMIATPFVPALIRDFEYDLIEAATCR